MLAPTAHGAKQTSMKYEQFPQSADAVEKVRLK
jgi:hypothetical protein